MEETSGAAEAATARRGIVESRWSSTVSLWDFPNMSHSYSLRLVSAVEAGAKTFDTSTQPPQTEMLRMVVAPFESCRKMHSLKTLRHDYQTAPCEVMMA